MEAVKLAKLGSRCCRWFRHAPTLLRKNTGQVECLGAGRNRPRPDDEIWDWVTLNRHRVIGKEVVTLTCRNILTFGRRIAYDSSALVCACCPLQPTWFAGTTIILLSLDLPTLAELGSGHRAIPLQRLERILEFIHTTATAAEKLKRLAKLQCKGTETSYASALDAVAKKDGYNNWKHVTWCVEQSKSVAVAAASLRALPEPAQFLVLGQPPESLTLMSSAPRLRSKRMENISTFDAKESFDSLNGGIDMWISRLADDLAKHGTLLILQGIEADIASTQDPDDKADLHQVSRGLMNFDRNALETAVATAEEPFQRMHTLQVQFQHCEEELVKLKRQWDVAADAAKLELSAWGTWAEATEIARSNELFPFFYNRFGISRESHEYICMSSVFESPKSFDANVNYFRGIVDAIRERIASKYRAANHPEALDRPAFDMAVDALEDLHKKHKVLVLKEDEVRQELITSEARYASSKQSLVVLLAQMSDTAQWALFRLRRSDLHKRAPV